jgi:hypothetical protein
MVGAARFELATPGPPDFAMPRSAAIDLYKLLDAQFGDLAEEARP